MAQVRCWDSGYYDPCPRFGLGEGGVKIGPSPTPPLPAVVTALTKTPRACHIPYWDSILTKLLQQNLGGNGKLLVCGTCGPKAPHDDSLWSVALTNRFSCFVSFVSWFCFFCFLVLLVFVSFLFLFSFASPSVTLTVSDGGCMRARVCVCMYVCLCVCVKNSTHSHILYPLHHPGI